MNQSQTDETEKPKIYDLGDRTLRFAQMVRDYVKGLPKSVSNAEYGVQLVRSSGSVGANYIEAQEALGRKDFGLHIRISRKEAKESKYWLELTEPSLNQDGSRERLIREATELTKIFGSIVEKVKPL